ncbi:MAG TPA: hypothetical protein PK402_07145 [Tepidisphaeraceae bacterium]|nr:hypothetical protein [Tepidisphaeraceae bacterium]
MSTLESIEQAIRQLSPQELSQLEAWFAEHIAKAWDSKFEADVQSGKLDALNQEALNDIRRGRFI